VEICDKFRPDNRFGFTDIRVYRNSKISLSTAEALSPAMAFSVVDCGGSVAPPVKHKINMTPATHNDSNAKNDKRDTGEDGHVNNNNSKNDKRDTGEEAATTTTRPTQIPSAPARRNALKLHGMGAFDPLGA